MMKTLFLSSIAALFLATGTASAATDDFFVWLILSDKGAIHYLIKDVENCSPDKAQKAEKERITWLIKDSRGDYTQGGEIIAARCFPGRLKNCVQARMREQVPADKKQLAEVAATCFKN